MVLRKSSPNIKKRRITWVNNTVGKGYRWKLICKKIFEFETPISEEFDSHSKISKLIPGLKIGFLQGDIRLLNTYMSLGYIDLILNQKNNQISSNFSYFSESMSVNKFLVDIRNMLLKNNKKKSSNDTTK